jgi:NTP pyrophosphatase (non-canonical NTP hydrolase)
MNQIEFDHQQMVQRLGKPGWEIHAQLTGLTCNLWHMATGISGEAGELLDAIKKAAIYNKSLDMENVIEELGDLEFYMEGLRKTLNISRNQCLEANMEKLYKRYPGYKYSDESAQKRKDKESERHPSEHAVDNDVPRLHTKGQVEKRSILAKARTLHQGSGPSEQDDGIKAAKATKEVAKTYFSIESQIQNLVAEMKVGSSHHSYVYNRTMVLDAIRKTNMKVRTSKRADGAVKVTRLL